MSRSQSPPWIIQDGRRFNHCRVDISLLADDRLGAYELSVYLGLCAHAEIGTGHSFPSKATLARYIDASERKVYAAIKNLEAAGYVRVEKRKGKSSVFTLLPPPDLTLAPGAGVPDDHASESSQTQEPRAGDPGTRCRTTQAPRADEQEPENKNQEQEGANGGARRAGSSETDPDVARAFTEFWDSWTPTGTRGKGPRKAAQERFAKLGPKLRERMLTTTRGYLAMCESQQRATVDCATWLGTSDKSWRAWEDEFAAETVTIRDDYATLPPAEWTAEERALVARQAAERPPDMWEPAVLRLLIHERPDGTQVRNTLGTVPFPPASDTPGVQADDGTLMAWWAERRSAAA